MLPQLRLTLLGTFQAMLDDKPVQGFVSSKAQALLAYLAMAERPPARTELATLLWGEMPEADAQTNLRKALSNLRQLLGPYLLIDRREACLNPLSPHWVDTAAFQQEALKLLPHNETAPGSLDNAALARLQACANGYSGEFLAGMQVRAAVGFEDWLLLQRERLHSLASELLYHLGAQLGARRRYTEALAASKQLLELDPWNEEFHRQRILLLAYSGQRSAALRQYEICRKTLQTELNISPGAETQAIYQRLAQDQSPMLKQPGLSITSRGHRLPFTGRESEHAWLTQRWGASRRWQGGLTLVAGETGIGKTRLVQQILDQVTLSGGIVLQGRCYEFNRAIPYQAIHDAMQNYLASLPPDKRPTLSDDLLMDFEQILMVVRQAWPDGMAIFLDDLQWADADTIDLLQYLVRRLVHAPCWLIGAYRPEETHPHHPLIHLIQSLEAEGLVFTLPLLPLPRQTVADLAHTLFGSHSQDKLANTLFDESQGNPFLLTELVTWLEDNPGSQDLEANFGDLDLPTLLADRVQKMVQRRVEHLDETSQYLLTLAAALGQPFSPALLEAAGECRAETVQQAVAEWGEKHLVRPSGEALDFAHDNIRTVVYQNVPPALRRLLHARLSATLEAFQQAQAVYQADMLAYHFDHAHNWPKALHYLTLAGEQSGRACSHEQAQSHYLRALQVLRQQLPAAPQAVQQEFELLSKLEALYDLQGRRSEQQEALEGMARLAGLAANAPACPLTGPQFQIEVRLRQSRQAEAVSDYPAAAAAAKLAIATAESAGQPKLAAAGYRHWAYAMRRQGLTSQAQELYQKALEIAETAADWAVLSDCLQGLALIARDQKRFDDAHAYLARSLTLCQAADDRRSISDAYNIEGLIYQQQGDYEQAETCFKQSLSMRREVGDRRGVALVLNNLGRLVLEQGDLERAKDLYAEAIDLSTSVGDRQCQAVAQHGLFRVFEAQSKRHAAYQHAWQALSLYRKIGSRMAAHKLIGEMKIKQII